MTCSHINGYQYHCQIGAAGRVSCHTKRRLATPDRQRYDRRDVRTLPQVIECYLEHEARALATAAAHLTGAYPNGIARRHYWPAIIRAAWDSGLRRGDLWRLKRRDIRRDRTALIVQSKTGRPVVCRFHPSTLKALDLADGHLTWSLCEWCFGVHFQEIVELSSVRKGTFRWLRRGSGSRVEADNPGLGHGHLGNQRIVFEKHYDAQISCKRLKTPPEL